MSALREVQTTFCDAIFSGQDESLLAQLEEQPEVARRRIAAYRRSVCGNLNAALLATYPVVANIVGLPFFREAAKQYVLTHPSLSGDLNEYGSQFAEFLADYAHAQELPYLPDVARLEWRVQEIYYAGDAGPADLSALAEIPPQRHGELRFFLAPDCARLDSRWPLHDIWRVNQPGYDGDMQLDLAQGAHLLVLRREGLVQVEPLSRGTAALFDALNNGETLDAATGLALAADPGFDLASALQWLAASGLLLGAELAGDMGSAS